MRKIIFFITLILIIVFFGRSLNPLSNSMFTFHDETQPARIQQFVLDLKNLQIPPRLAPDFSFKMGYPVFNFYAPASYWITSIFSLAGMGIVSALKLSFLFSILVGFLAIYLLLKEYFDFFPSLTGAVLYISSFYYPLDIFVRGNLGEVWFLALSPLVFFLVEKNSKKSTPLLFFLLTISLSLLFTVHNLLSTVAIFLVLGFILIRQHKKTNILALIFALLLSSYFLLPMITENHFTYASYVAKLTRYMDHFICPYQLWQSPWGYGGSVPGCSDGMSLKIGKLQIIFAVLGLIFFFINTFKTKKNNVLLSGYFLLLTVGSLFMATYYSQFIWDSFSSVLSIFQFPWRFIAFSLAGLAFFSAYFFHTMRLKFKNVFLAFLTLFIIINYSKYFAGQSVSKRTFEKTYLSQDYIENKVAYKIAEYLPRTANYDAWRKYEKTPPKKALVNIHFFPFWTILINGKSYTPSKFDELGRPILNLKRNSNVQIVYRETPVEKLGNFITLIFFGILLYSLRNKNLWNRLKD